jgi:hypothetical protein
LREVSVFIIRIAQNDLMTLRQHSARTDFGLVAQSYYVSWSICMGLCFEERKLDYHRNLLNFVRAPWITGHMISVLDTFRHHTPDIINDIYFIVKGKFAVCC